MNVVTGREVVNGLSSHTTRGSSTASGSSATRGRASSCGSAKTAGSAARAGLAGWARGLAVLEGALLVGESRGRDEPSGAEATIATVDRASWEVVGRIPVPVREIYDIVVVPRSLAEALSGRPAGT